MKVLTSACPVPASRSVWSAEGTFRFGPPVALRPPVSSKKSYLSDYVKLTPTIPDFSSRRSPVTPSFAPSRLCFNPSVDRRKKLYLLNHVELTPISSDYFPAYRSPITSGLAPSCLCVNPKSSPRLQKLHLPDRVEVTSTFPDYCLPHRSPITSAFGPLRLCVKKTVWFKIKSP